MPFTISSVLILIITFINRSTSFTLLTFDVDGTLLGSTTAETSCHAQSYSIACGKMFSPNGKPIEPVAQVLPRHEYHGSTDGLILLRLAKAALNIDTNESMPKLDKLMDCMYEHIQTLDDDAIASTMDVLPGVIAQLEILSTLKDKVACGLVTGNVEGIARRKMKSMGIWDTNALSDASKEQRAKKTWSGSEDIAFLGGFGSDYCSGNIVDYDRNHLDRSEQIEICYNRLKEDENGEKKKSLNRVVHIGDAPSDVLAAKAFAERNTNKDLCIGLVAVATGSYSAEELSNLIGEPIPGRWEPVVLKDGMADPDFLKHCGVL